MQPKYLIALYLAAIVAANLSVALLGPGMVIINAFVLIALDLTTRDRLHDAWRGPHLWRNMALLIGAGSALSVALNLAALPVAVASCAAFALAGAADALVYSRLEHRSWCARANGSNVVSALVDSLVFLGVLAALGGLPWDAVPLLAAGQWAAKAIGGALWATALRNVRAA